MMLNQTKLINDGRRLLQTLFNLMSNALKFSKQNGQVTIKMKEIINEKKEIMVKISVKDQGCGIPANIKDKLNVIFSTHGHGNYENKEGLGVGIFNIQQYIQIMGPNDQCLKFGNNKIQGACFKFIIFKNIDNFTVDPSSIEDENSENIISFQSNSFNKVSQIQQNSNFQILSSLNTKFSFNQNTSLEAIFENQKIQIMIVEDNPICMFAFQQQLKSIFQKEEYTLSKAWTGDECLQQFKVNYYDIIFLDYNLPDFKGDQCAIEIRMREKNKNKLNKLLKQSIIIGFTSYNNMEAQQIFINCKINEFLQKPAKQQDLKELFIRQKLLK